MFTEQELELRRFRRTAFYQGPFFTKLQDVIIDKQYRVTRACEDLGERWSHASKFLSGDQKRTIEELTNKYSRNGGKRLRKIATRTHVA